MTDLLYEMAGLEFHVVYSDAGIWRGFLKLVII